jgi:hypothetical protein
MNNKEQQESTQTKRVVDEDSAVLQALGVREDQRRVGVPGAVPCARQIGHLLHESLALRHEMLARGVLRHVSCGINDTEGKCTLSADPSCDLSTSSISALKS